MRGMTSSGIQYGNRGRNGDRTLRRVNRNENGINRKYKKEWVMGPHIAGASTAKSQTLPGCRFWKTEWWMFESLFKLIEPSFVEYN